MRQLQQKIARVDRLRDIEQNKMNVLVVQLSEIEARLTEQSDRLASLLNQIETSAPAGNGRAVDQLSHTSQWIQYTQMCAALMKQAIAETESKRDEMMQSIRDQKTTVQGWESLIDRLKEDVTVQQQKEESLLADDRFLSSRVVR